MNQIITYRSNDKLHKINFVSKIFYSKIYSLFGIRVIDLLTRAPTGYIKRKLIGNIINDNHLKSFISLDLKIIGYTEKLYNKRLPFYIVTENKFKQKVNIILFNLSINFVKKLYKIGKIYRITGTLEKFNNNYQIIHPESTLDVEEIHKFETIEPKYNLGRLSINKKKFRELILKNLYIFLNSNFPEEWIDNQTIIKNDWEDFKNSVFKIHKPNPEFNKAKIENIRKRLAYDEILSNFLIVNLLRRQNFEKEKKFICKKNELLDVLTKSLKFDLTNDQKKVIDEIVYDISRKRMFRLLQGDVGSGKTIIALLSVVNIVKSGFQAAVMTPTEILAKQHFNYFSKLLNKYKIKIKLLTGKLSVKEKKKIYRELAENQIDILIGTHSLFNKKLIFNNLGIIIIDEQHKFGVNQRLSLQKKSPECHVLIMSATPIPRSLTFAIYGEIDVSFIKEKPKGRKEIKTSIININQLNELFNGLKRKVNKNEKVFWILPYIGEEEQIEGEKRVSIKKRFETLNKILPNKVDFIHGKLKKVDIEKKINSFINGDIKVLVSTTLIEVGVDIPEASIIVIEYANNFGLAQLHQLRGRIGRNNLESNCVLLHHNELSEDGKKRLLIMKKSSDGFFIAEQDLKLRGSGEIFGTKQTGLPTWKFFNPYLDLELVPNVRENCKSLINTYQKNKDKINFLTSSFFNEKDIDNYFTG